MHPVPKKRRKVRTRKDGHPGVWFGHNDVGSRMVRWRDPVTRTIVKRTLESLGIDLSNAESVLQWARDKSKQLHEMKLEQRGRTQVTLYTSPWKDLLDAYKTEFMTSRERYGEQKRDRTWKVLWNGYLKRATDFLAARCKKVGDLDAVLVADYRLDLMQTKKRVAKKGAKKGEQAFEVTRKARAPATINRHLGALSAFLRWARAKKYIRLSTDEIKESLSLLEVDDKKPRVLSPAELKRLLKAIVANDTAKFAAGRDDKGYYLSGKRTKEPKHKYAPMSPFVILSLLMGTRPGEAKALLWNDVNFDAQEIVFLDEKRRADRIYPFDLSPALKRLLMHLKLRAGGSEHVIAGQDPERKPRDDKPVKKKNVRKSTWKRVMMNAGLEEVSPKHFRSTCVSAVSSAGLVSEQLFETIFGHTPEVSRKHYRKSRFEARGAQTVEEALGIAAELEKAMDELGFAKLDDAEKAASA